MQPNIVWIFRKKLHITYGSRLMVCGSTPELGSWNPSQAIPMNWSEGDNWQVTVKVSSIFQYKHVIQEQTGNLYWDQGPNVIVNASNPQLFDQQLKLMSYNIRYDNSGDGQFAWKYRKDLAIQVLLKELPAVIGVQEALKHQKEQLYQGLKNYYDYYGAARDLDKGQECGIFYLRHRFKVHGEGLVWYNETKTPGKIGFGARLPRNLTYLVLQQPVIKVKFVIINTHLDHETAQSQKESVRIIIETCEALMKNFPIDGIFVMGDFNLNQNSQTLNSLKESKLHFLSARQKANLSDNVPTFHDFKGEEMMVKVAKGQNTEYVTIDHIFYSSKVLLPEVYKTYVVNKPYMSDHYPIFAIFKKV